MPSEYSNVSRSGTLIRRAIGLCPLARDWPASALDALTASARLKRYARHQQIWPDYQTRREVLIVVSGCVALESLDACGDRFLLSLHGPSDIIGLIRLLQNAAFTYSYHAREPTALVHIPSDAFRATLDAHPLLWKDVCLLMLARANEQIAIRRQHTLERLDCQVAHAVTQLARTHGQPDQTGGALSVRVSQSDLAAMLSVSRQTINKELRRLDQHGLVHAEYGRLVIRDLSGLEQIARGFG